MSEKKNWGSTVMGWFIVQDPQPGDASQESDYVPFQDSAGAADSAPAGAGGDDDLIRRAARQEPLNNVFSSTPPAATGGQVDFDQVFEAAGIAADERERITRTKDLLSSLPPETDAKVKQQIVMASLRAFGVPIEQIIETGAEELQALEAYIRAGAADTEKVAEEADQRVKQLEEEIVSLRTVMQQRVEEQAAVVRSCNARKLEVQKVLEFFGQEAVAKVVRESPKLQEPAGSGQ